MSDPAVSHLVDVLIKSDKADQIESVLLGQGVALCVVREWANEPGRRDVMLARRVRRKARKEASKYGGRGDQYRRIIHSEIVKEHRLKLPVLLPSGETAEKEIVIPGREFQLHATKGWRNYRVTT